jgi:hypothetical protein
LYTYCGSGLFMHTGFAMGRIYDLHGVWGAWITSYEHHWLHRE